MNMIKRRHAQQSSLRIQRQPSNVVVADVTMGICHLITRKIELWYCHFYADRIMYCCRNIPKANFIGSGPVSICFATNFCYNYFLLRYGSRDVHIFWILHRNMRNLQRLEIPLAGTYQCALQLRPERSICMYWLQPGSPPHPITRPRNQVIPPFVRNFLKSYWNIS